MRCKDIPLLEFFREDLNPEETEAIAGHLEACPSCRQKLSIMAALQSVRPATEKVPERLRGFHSLAAGLLILCVLALLFRPWSSGGPGLPDLATREPYPHFPLDSRSLEKLYDEDLRQRAFSAYRQGDYKKAAEFLSRLPEDAEVQFYRGVSHYFLKNYRQALDYLEKASVASRNWRCPSLWYQANAYLQLGDLEKSKASLENLMQLGCDSQQQGLNLLRKLER